MSDSTQSHADGSGEGRIARSLRLSAIAWRIVRSDRAILGLAVVSTLSAALGLALIYDLTGMFSGHLRAGGAHFALVTLILAFPLTFTSVFFNTAIAAAAAASLDGKRMSFREALSVPVRRLGQVALWSLLVSIVGVVIEQIASRLPLIGNLAVRLVGLSWSLASMFAVPILATEGCSAPQCLRRSADLVKKRWGEGISGNVIITAWSVVLIVPVAFVFGVVLAATGRHTGVRLGVLAAMVTVIVVITAAAGVIRQTFGVVLYRYAVTGLPEGGFSEADLTTPFSRGIVGARTGATQPTSRPSGESMWLWIGSAAISAALTLLWELNRHHFAAHRLSGRVMGGIILWLAVTVVVRLVAELIARLRRI